ncbi:MAG: ABC transporter substrate-binding protein [Gammaproteobacteria bacterium]
MAKNGSTKSQGKRWHRVALGLAALVVASVIGAYFLASPRGQGDAPPRVTKITYAMPITLAAIPAYVAAEKGFWQEEGLEVERKMFSAGRLAVDALLSESAEVMSVSETPLVHAILKGNDVYIVSTVTEHQETKFIGRKDHGIKKPGDLRGKRIATLPGTNSDYFMYEFLQAHGISVSDVKVTNLAPPDMVTALVSGNIDGYFAWEPHISYAQKRLGDKAMVIAPGDLYHGRHCIAMNRKYVEKNPNIVEKLVRGFLRAEEFVKENPEEAQQIVAKVTGLEMDTVEALWREYHIKVQLDQRFLAILEKEGNWARAIDLQAKGTVERIVNSVYTNALKTVRPERVEIGN